MQKLTEEFYEVQKLLTAAEEKLPHATLRVSNIQQNIVEEMQQTEIGEGTKQPGHMKRSMYQKMIACEARLSNLESVSTGPCGTGDLG